MDIRLQKEEEYHNKLFFKGVGRKNVAKYYLITKSSSTFYRESIRCHCTNKKVLECGIGIGSYINFLLQNGANVTGIDLSGVAIDKAKESFNNFSTDRLVLYVMNVEELEFDNDSFDLICGTGILHHLNLDSAFNEISRTLKRNGIAIFKEPLGHNPFINYYRKLTPQYRTEDEHPLLIKELKLAESFFDKVDLHFFHIFSILAVPFKYTRFFDPILYLLERFDNIFIKLFPAIRKYAWQVVIICYKNHNIKDKVN